MTPSDRPVDQHIQIYTHPTPVQCKQEPATPALPSPFAPDIPSSSAFAPRLNESRRKNRKLLKDGSGEVWPEEVERIFLEGLIEYSNLVRNQQARGRLVWRNNYLVNFLRKFGIERSRKQVASHIQVLRNVWKNKPEHALVALQDSQDPTTPSSSDTNAPEVSYWPLPPSPSPSSVISTPSMSPSSTTSPEPESAGWSPSPLFNSFDIPPSPSEGQHILLNPFEHQFRPGSASEPTPFGETRPHQDITHVLGVCVRVEGGAPLYVNIDTENIRGRPSLPTISVSEIDTGRSATIKPLMSRLPVRFLYVRVAVPSTAGLVHHAPHVPPSPPRRANASATIESTRTLVHAIASVYTPSGICTQIQTPVLRASLNPSYASTVEFTAHLPDSVLAPPNVTSWSHGVVGNLVTQQVYDNNDQVALVIVYDCHESATGETSAHVANILNDAEDPVSTTAPPCDCDVLGPGNRHMHVVRDYEADPTWSRPDECSGACEGDGDGGCTCTDHSVTPQPTTPTGYVRAISVAPSTALQPNESPLSLQLNDYSHIASEARSHTGSSQLSTQSQLPGLILDPQPPLQLGFPWCVMPTPQQPSFAAAPASSIQSGHQYHPSSQHYPANADTATFVSNWIRGLDPGSAPGSSTTPGDLTAPSPSLPRPNRDRGLTTSSLASTITPHSPQLHSQFNFAAAPSREHMGPYESYHPAASYRT